MFYFCHKKKGQGLVHLASKKVTFRLQFQCSILNLHCVSPFYVSLVNVWRQMETGRLVCDTSLYWLLILKGGRLGTAWGKEGTPMMHETFKNKGITIHLLELTGVHLNNAAALAQKLVVQSVRSSQLGVGQVQEGIIK